jgi:hypothetical protein
MGSIYPDLARTSRLRTDRATRRGLQPDENLEAIVRAHIREAQTPG